MNWEVFTYGGGEFLRLVFNGIAAISGNGDYVSVLKISAMIGVLWVLLEGAFHTHRGLNWQWLLIIVLVYDTAMVPKTNVVVTDRIDASQSGVVANVPLGLAAFAGTASLLGDWITRAYETVFSLPDDLQYARNGMIFGQRLVEASTQFEFTDQRVAGNLSEFWQNCVFYDILLGRYTWDDLMAADDLWGFIQSNTSLARTFVYTHPMPVAPRLVAERPPQAAEPSMPTSSMPSGRRTISTGGSSCAIRTRLRPSPGSRPRCRSPTTT